jgi:REP element-mobilizing transposase RayT
MTNHIHLLVTPRKPLAIAKLMQSVGRQPVAMNYALGRRATKGKAGRPKGQPKHRRGQIDLL